MFLQSNVCCELFLSCPASSSFQFVIALTQCHTKLHVFDCEAVATRSEMPKIEIATNVMYRSVICLTSYSVASLERCFRWLQKSLMKRTSLPNFFANLFCTKNHEQWCVFHLGISCVFVFSCNSGVNRTSFGKLWLSCRRSDKKNRQAVWRLSSQPCHRAHEVGWLVFHSE